MDTSRSPSNLYYRPVRLTPKKSLTIESVQKRRKFLHKSEKAAYWALFNSFVALLLYYDLCYLKLFNDTSIIVTFIEWMICVIFLASAYYDYMVHFWPHTFMKPIVVNPIEMKLLGIQEDEFGFKVEEPIPEKKQPIYDDLPPFEIYHSFEEDEKLVVKKSI